MIPGERTVTGHGSNAVLNCTWPRRPDSPRSSVSPRSLNLFGPMLTSNLPVAA